MSEYGNIFERVKGLSRPIGARSGVTSSPGRDIQFGKDRDWSGLRDISSSNRHLELDRVAVQEIFQWTRNEDSELVPRMCGAPFFVSMRQAQSLVDTGSYRFASFN